MSEIKTGGYAFPVSSVVVHRGMTLRDYFAAQAIAGGVCFEQEDGCYRGAEEAARLAYEIADAMLKARENK